MSARAEIRVPGRARMADRRPETGRHATHGSGAMARHGVGEKNAKAAAWCVFGGRA